jgi:MYXO-CTERM domain-containing protein
VFFQVADCASDFIMQNNPESNQATGATDTWELLSTPIVAPATAVSVRVFARPRKQEAGGSVDVLFDAIELPEPGAAGLGLAALGALGALARRRARC